MKKMTHKPVCDACEKIVDLVDPKAIKFYGKFLIYKGNDKKFELPLTDWLHFCNYECLYKWIGKVMGEKE